MPIIKIEIDLQDARIGDLLAGIYESGLWPALTEQEALEALSGYFERLFDRMLDNGIHGLEIAIFQHALDFMARMRAERKRQEQRTQEVFNELRARIDAKKN